MNTKFSEINDSNICTDRRLSSLGVSCSPLTLVISQVVVDVQKGHYLRSRSYKVAVDIQTKLDCIDWCSESTACSVRKSQFVMPQAPTNAKQINSSFLTCWRVVHNATKFSDKTKYNQNPVEGGIYWRSPSVISLLVVIGIYCFNDQYDLEVLNLRILYDTTFLATLSRQRSLDLYILFFWSNKFRNLIYKRYVSQPLRAFQWALHFCGTTKPIQLYLQR